MRLGMSAERAGAGQDGQVGNSPRTNGCTAFCAGANSCSSTCNGDEICANAAAARTRAIPMAATSPSAPRCLRVPCFLPSFCGCTLLAPVHSPFGSCPLGPCALDRPAVQRYPGKAWRAILPAATPFSREELPPAGRNARPRTGRVNPPSTAGLFLVLSPAHRPPACKPGTPCVGQGSLVHQAPAGHRRPGHRRPGAFSSPLLSWVRAWVFGAGCRGHLLCPPKDAPFAGARLPLPGSIQTRAAAGTTRSAVNAGPAFAAVRARPQEKERESPLSDVRRAIATIGPPERHTPFADAR